MGTIDIFWIFFMLVTLQPILRQKFRDAARHRMLQRIEQERNSRVITLIHRQETMSLLGFPVLKYIDINDSEEVLRAVDMTDDEVPIDLVLHTPGGLVLASLQIARAIKKHPAKVRVHVPHYAMSGGTLIALAADEIVMCEHAVLGPVDPQVGRFPAASLLKVVKEKDINEIDDETLILADQAEKAVRQVRESVEELLADKMSAERASNLAQLLTEGRWTHDYAITPEEGRELGLPVSTEIPQPIMTMMALYPQPMRRQSTVEYTPLPKRSEPRQSE